MTWKSASPELVGAAAGVRKDRHPPAQVPGQLYRCEPGGIDVIGGVRARVPGRSRMASAAPARYRAKHAALLDKPTSDRWAMLSFPKAAMLDLSVPTCINH